MFTRRRFALTGSRSASSSAGSPKPWMMAWRRSSQWETSTGSDVQDVRAQRSETLIHVYTHPTSSLCAVITILAGIVLNIVSTWTVPSHICLLNNSALPKEYQRIGKAFQNLSSVFTSSGYQGTARQWGNASNWHVHGKSFFFFCCRWGNSDWRHDGSRKDVWGNRSDRGRAGELRSFWTFSY